MVAYRILVSAPVPFGLIWVSNWVGLGWDWVWGDWGLRGWGLGLDNKSYDDNKISLTNLVMSQAPCSYPMFLDGLLTIRASD